MACSKPRNASSDLQALAGLLAHPGQGLGTVTRTVATILLVVAATLIYGQTARHQFVNFDDNEYVYANPTVKTG